MDKVIAEGVGMTPEMAKLMKDEVHAEAKQVLAIGGEQYMMVLPTELAVTLENFRDNNSSDAWLSILEMPMRMWKKWVLINPRAVLRYNVNNLSGDLAAIIAGNPRALLKVPEAWRMLRHVMYQDGEPEAVHMDAINRGVIDSNLTMQEINEYDRSREFKGLIDTKLPHGLKEIRTVWKQMEKARKLLYLVLLAG